MVSCHQPGGEGFNVSGFDLTTYEGLMKGTKYGPMVIAGKPDDSNLFRLVNGDARVAHAVSSQAAAQLCPTEYLVLDFRRAQEQLSTKHSRALRDNRNKGGKARSSAGAAAHAR